MPALRGLTILQNTNLWILPASLESWKRLSRSPVTREMWQWARHLKMSRPFDKLNTLYSKESWIRSSAACTLDFLFKKIHQPIFFYQRLSTRLTSQVKKDSICELCCILCRYPSSGRQSQKESGKLPGTAVQQVVFWGTLWKAYRHLPNEIIKKYIFRNNSTY